MQIKVKQNWGVLFQNVQQKSVYQPARFNAFIPKTLIIRNGIKHKRH